ncbi:hypothetical protein HN958_01695 [Candidatus Falkowbacteria bacterium]|jgi:hypothetical protein|nr:hypothetical protein [Candidatus Falkowbacteria bacterium]
MNEGEQFLKKIYSNLHTESAVEGEQKRRRRAGEKTSQKPVEKIRDFMDVLEKIHGHHDDPAVLERIKKSYHKKYVIKEENVPESYWDSQRRIIINEGRGADFEKDENGKIDIPDDIKDQQIEVIQQDQRTTLDTWVTYLSSEDALYPMWAKYWAFQSMLKMSVYDKKKKAFSKRKKDTVAPFSDLNQEALDFVLRSIEKKYKNQIVKLPVDDLGDGEENNDVRRLRAEDLEKKRIELQEELEKLMKTENFAKLYAFAIEKVTMSNEELFKETLGEWVKYEKGSDHMPLVKSLQGHGTGWCTAGENTAKTQLSSGDFFVYYSNDKRGESTIPRVAIRMQDNKIAEVRGVSSDQNLDPHISDVADKKLAKFSDGKEYQVKVADMKKLTSICNKEEQREKLTVEELRFIYQMDGKIRGFGYSDDPRINEILRKRSRRDDLSKVYGIEREELALRESELYKPEIKRYYCSRDEATFDVDLSMFPVLDDRVIRLLFDSLNYKILLKNIEKFPNLNIDTFFVDLIKEGGLAVKALLENIEIFETTDHSKIVNKLLEANQGVYVAMFMKKLKGVDQSKVLDHLIEQNEANECLSDFSQQFDQMNHQELLERIIDSGQGQRIPEFIDRYINVDCDKIADKLIENNQIDNILGSSRHFSQRIIKSVIRILIDKQDFDKVNSAINQIQHCIAEKDLEKLLLWHDDYLLSNALNEEDHDDGWFNAIFHERVKVEEVLVERIESRKRIDKSTKKLIESEYADPHKINGYNKELALKVLAEGAGLFIAQYLDRFDGLDEEIIIEIIKRDNVGPHWVTQNLMVRFFDLDLIDHKKVALALIKYGNVKIFIENIEKFKGLDSEVRQSLIDAGHEIDAKIHEKCFTSFNNKIQRLDKIKS